MGTKTDERRKDAATSPSSGNGDDDTSSDSRKNTCAFCLDSLATAPFGTAVPCGHCFHVCYKDRP